MPKFETPAEITAVVDIPAGRVQLIAAERPDTTVEVLPSDASKGRDVKSAEQTQISYAEGVLRIETPVKNQLLGPSGSLEVTVQLPVGSRVEVKAAGAELRAVGRFGDIAFEGAYGVVKVDEAASARVTTASGDVSIGRLTGPAEVSTTQGNIKITEAVRGKVALRTQSGNVSIDAAAGVSAALGASTGYGRITNALKNDGNTQLDITATTAHGDITARSR